MVAKYARCVAFFLTVLVISLTATQVAAQPTSDNDSDGVPDFVESEVCGREFVRGLINGTKSAGTCPAPDDYEHPPALKDADRDGFPDFLEPVICGVENQNDDADGSCDGEDYFGPVGGPGNTIDGVNRTLASARSSALWAVSNTTTMVNQTTRETKANVTQTVWYVTMVINNTKDAATRDTDGDGVIDAIEPTLCLIEARGQELDGTCTGDNYTPPTNDDDNDGLADPIEQALCARKIVEQLLNSTGWMDCSAGDFTAPQDQDPEQLNVVKKLCDHFPHSGIPVPKPAYPRIGILECTIWKQQP